MIRHNHDGRRPIGSPTGPAIAADTVVMSRCRESRRAVASAGARRRLPAGGVRRQWRQRRAVAVAAAAGRVPSAAARPPSSSAS